MIFFWKKFAHGISGHPVGICGAFTHHIQRVSFVLAHHIQARHLYAPGGGAQGRERTEPTSWSPQAPDCVISMSQFLVGLQTPTVYSNFPRRCLGAAKFLNPFENRRDSTCSCQCTGRSMGVHIASYTGISYLEARRVLHGPKLLSVILA